MAFEIQLSAGLSVARDGLSVAGSGSVSITQAGTLSSAQVQTIGTTTEALDLGDITNLGYVYLKNTDATNFVQIGLATPVTSSDAMITLLPGEFAVFPTRIETIYAKADTAACGLNVVLASL